MAKLKIKDLELYYEIHGKGDPLLLIAGLASDSQSWLPIIKNLSNNFQVIILDNRGCGRTTPMETEIKLSMISDDCIALAKHLNIEKFNVLGHSMGGMVAIDLAIRYPGNVNKLVLAGTAAKISLRGKLLLEHLADSYETSNNLDSWYKNLFLWLFTDSFFTTQSQIDAVTKFALDYPFQQSPSAFRRQVEAIIDFDYSKEISSIKANTLIINGSEDAIFHPDYSRNSLSKIYKPKFLEIENAAHSLFIEQPEKISKIVIDFLMR